MAWIVKNSATMEVARRDEPYLDAALKAQLESDVIPRYPTRQAATLPVLRTLQEKHHYLPYQAIEEAAEFLGVSAVEVLDTATFYEEFFLEPKGKYLVQICQSLSCELTGSTDLLNRVKAKLGIDVDQTTEDGRFTLIALECLGSCGTAPAALVNERLHERLTPENFERVLDALDE